jgi:hypothetical protein
LSRLCFITNIVQSVKETNEIVLLTPTAEYMTGTYYVILSTQVHECVLTMKIHLGKLKRRLEQLFNKHNNRRKSVHIVLGIMNS